MAASPNFREVHSQFPSGRCAARNASPPKDGRSWVSCPPRPLTCPAASSSTVTTGAPTGSGLPGFGGPPLFSGRVSRPSFRSHNALIFSAVSATVIPISSAIHSPQHLQFLCCGTAWRPLAGTLPSTHCVEVGHAALNKCRAYRQFEGFQFIR